MHYLLQKDSPKTRSIVHAHPTHVIGAMYAGFDLQKICSEFPEIYRYTKVGPTVPTLPATSVALGEATAKAFGLETSGSVQFDIVGQDRHGVTAIGTSVWDCFENIERLNHICEIVLASGARP